MSSAPVHIIVDDRERAGGMVPAILAARDDVTVEIARLDVGDYQVQQRVVVERKTASDFAASLIDGRLFRQAAALASSPKRAVLVLEACSEDCGPVGSVQAILTASADVLVTVDGIGEKTAAKMRCILEASSADSPMYDLGRSSRTHRPPGPRLDTR